MADTEVKKVKKPFGKAIIAGAIYGFVLGTILYIATAGLDSALGIFAPNTDVAMFFVGLLASIGIAYVNDMDGN